MMHIYNFASLLKLQYPDLTVSLDLFCDIYTVLSALTNQGYPDFTAIFGEFFTLWQHF